MLVVAGGARASRRVLEDAREGGIQPCQEMRLTINRDTPAKPECTNMTQSRFFVLLKITKKILH